jgi:hypothetical protein
VWVKTDECPVSDFIVGLITDLCSVLNRSAQVNEYVFLLFNGQLSRRDGKCRLYAAELIWLWVLMLATDNMMFTENIYEMKVPL